ncbi:MFS transporter [Bradyrhizobium diazoefficiens]|uniref:MFS transporter n=1 Tax=Bradyrhizobium diazoefficiens TaxID=1355477 RepID=UPI00190C916C|nr:MFS transporter [Bradyrhizobium diazoefficiens]QQO12519.1 MFS transporter [Bradyrhizobium diazoefficiens]
MTTITTVYTTEDAGQLYTKIAWRIIPILILIFFFANLDRANVGFAALQMKQELGFSNAAYGFGAGIFFLGYFIFEIPSNIALEKVGAPIWFTRIVLTWGIATSALAFVHDATLFYVLRFVIGAAEAGAAPGVMLFLSQWVPDSQRGRFNALFWVSAPIAFVVSGPLSGFILTQLNGTLGYSGWRWLFLVEGLLTIAVAPLILLGLSNRIQDAPWLTASEKKAAQDAVSHVAEGADAHTYKDALRKPETLLCCGAYFLLLIGYYGIAFWLPQIIKQSGISDTWTIGWVSSLPWLAAGIAVLFVGPFSDSPGRRKAVRIASVSITAIGFWISAYFSASVGLALLGLTLAAVGILATSTVFWAILARIYAGSAAAIGFATINSLGNLGGFVSPYMLGVVTDFTGATVLGMYLIATSIVLSGVAMSVAFRKMPSA